MPVSILNSVFGKYLASSSICPPPSPIHIMDEYLFQYVVVGVQSINEIPDLCFELPNTGAPDSENLHSFLEAINAEKPYTPPIQIIR